MLSVTVGLRGMAVAVVAVEEARVRVQDPMSFRIEGFCATEAGGDTEVSFVEGGISTSLVMPSMLFVSSSKPRGLVEYALWKSVSESSVPAGVSGCRRGDRVPGLMGEGVEPL